MNTNNGTIRANPTMPNACEVWNFPLDFVHKIQSPICP